MFCYIHIPFCTSKCKYCRFASIGGKNNILVQKYLHHLIKDIQNFQEPGTPLESIYFGGGTPSILSEVELEKIINALKKKFGFEKNIEITLETTPQNISKENISSWETLGINRLSIGIQTLNDTALKEIGRVSKETILEKLELLQSSHIKNISCDFIIGLPYLQKGEVKNDIEFLLKKFSFITHISVYMLEDYYIPDEEGNNFDAITYPKNRKGLSLKEDEFQKEYMEVRNFLEKHGFFSYEISNFAKKGFECHHNQSYWNHSEVVGFGLGSHSYINGSRYAYADDFLGYYAGKIEYQETLNQKEIFLEQVMFGLRTSGLKKEIYEKLSQEKITLFIKDGLLQIENNILQITLEGIPLLDSIILELI